MKHHHSHSRKTTGPHSWIFPWGLILTFIVFIAAWLRFWHLGANPTGMSWDEAYLGYVGKMIVHTRRDEFGEFLPVVFKSFGDFKAPLAIYLTGISTSLFGLTAWAVRLPFALAGVFSVLSISGVVGLRTKTWGWGLLAGWLLATLPWHIHFSRVGFESGLALLGYLTFLLGWQIVRRADVQGIQRFCGWLAIILGALWALYVYHSSKIVLPAAGLSIGVWELLTARAYWIQRWKEITAAALLGSFGLIPFLISLQQGSANRASQVVFWKNLLPNESFWEKLISNIAIHIGPGFWIGGVTDSLRHGNAIQGVATLTLIVALLGGLAFLIWVRQPFPLTAFLPWTKQKNSSHTDLWLWAWLTIVGLVPAILGTEIPHSNRALLAAAPFIILTTLTLRLVWNHVKGDTKQLVIAMVILFTALESAHYWKDLTTDYAPRSAAAWLDGNNEASTWAAKQAAADRSVVITKEYGEPEIFFAFATGWPFDRYRWRDFGNASFADQDKLIDFGAEAIVSAQPLESTEYYLDSVVSRADGLPAYWLYQKQ